MPAPSRDDRRSSLGRKPNDLRNPFQVDRDRVLYSTEFRRLAGVTQVVSPVEGSVFHSRLTHTLKVAQIARRLAEMFIERDGTSGEGVVSAWGGLEPDVAEAAGLAHDLGHPPFGHIGEEELNRLMCEAAVREKHGVPPEAPFKTKSQKDEVKKVEGFEGNAQSFRIITTLAVRRPESPPGLDLTRATLNATLKYPHHFSPGNKKYGAYLSEGDALAFARGAVTAAGTNQCLEAQIMDWADDLTYCVHDVEDFYRAGRIPLDRLRTNPKERQAFRDWAIERSQEKNEPYPVGLEKVASVLDNFINLYVEVEGPYTGKRSQQQALYNVGSKLIHDFVTQTKLVAPPGDNGSGLLRSAEVLTQIQLLKDLIWYYVIYNPALAAQQHGQRLAIQTLFRVLDDAARAGRWYIFPPSYLETAEALTKEFKKSGETMPTDRRVRLVADAICSLTDQQAMRFYHRLTGSAPGSVLDPILS